VWVLHAHPVWMKDFLISCKNKHYFKCPILWRYFLDEITFKTSRFWVKQIALSGVVGLSRFTDGLERKKRFRTPKEEGILPLGGIWILAATSAPSGFLACWSSVQIFCLLLCTDSWFLKINLCVCFPYFEDEAHRHHCFSFPGELRLIYHTIS
jgi:hypothetical protein